MMNALLSAAQSQTTWTAVKATLLFTLALFLLRSARRVPAALRHRVAATTFVVALLLPLGAAWTRHYTPRSHTARNDRGAGAHACC